MPANVIFKRGLLASLPATLTDGNVYVTTDERAMYMDYNAGTPASPDVKRIRLGDFREYTWEQLQAIPTTNLSQSALYYVTDRNILAKWNGTTWIQINPPTAAAAIIGGVHVDTGNILKVYDASGNAITAKTVTFKATNAASVTTTDSGNSLTINADDTDTAGVLSANASATNNNVKLSLTNTKSTNGTAGTAVTSGQVTIKGTGLSAVVSDADGAISVNTPTPKVTTAAANGVVTVGLKDDAGNALSGTTSTFTIAGAGDNTVSTSGTTITVTGHNSVSALAATAQTTKGQIALTNSDNGAAATAAGTIDITGAGLTKVTSTVAGEVTINTPSPKVNTAWGASNGTVTVSLKDADGNALTGTDATIAHTIKYGKNASATATWASSAATLNVYTIGELDNLLAGINAMEFKGVISSSADYAALITAVSGVYPVKKGDTYKATVSGTIAAANSYTGAAVTYKTGDLLINTGNDDAAPIFAYVPSGDETVVTYALRKSGANLVLQDNGGNAKGTVVATEPIVLAIDDNANGATATISHAAQAVTTTAATAQTVSILGTASQSASFVKTIAANGTGHLTQNSAGTLSFSPLKTAAINGAVSGSTITLTPDIQDINNNSISAKTATTLSTSSLAFAGTANALTIDLVWGSF